MCAYFAVMVGGSVELCLLDVCMGFSFHIVDSVKLSEL